MKLRYIFAALLCLCLLIAPAAAAGGSGTAANPYIIETAAELQSMANDLSAHYRLANDIDLSGVTWTPIGSQSAGFYGSFDGNGKTIKNLVSRSSSAGFGFFGAVLSGAVIKDITFQDCTLTSSHSRSGVVIGTVLTSASSVIISNVDCVRCSLSSNNANVGYLVGANLGSTTITDCDISYSKISTTSGNLGIIGWCAGDSSMEITRCNIISSHAKGGSYASSYAGYCNPGVTIIIDSSTAQNCIIEVSDANPTGGFVGQFSGASLTVLNCDVINCIVKGTKNVGGFIGSCPSSGSVITVQISTVTDCTIFGSDMYVGGICGGMGTGATSQFSECTVTDSTIITSNYAAGICPLYNA